MPTATTDRQHIRREILRPLAEYLRQLRLAAGSPSLRRLRSRTAWLGVSSMSEVLNAKTGPKLDFVLAFQAACTGVAAEAGLAIEPVLTDPAIARQLWESQDIQLRLLRSNPLSHRRLHSMPPAPTDFVGRDIELSWLEQHLLRPDHSLRSATVDGMPGVGKTALVTAWVHSRPYGFPDGVYFIDLRGASPSGALDSAIALRRLLAGLGEPLEPTVDVDQLTDRYRTITGEREACVVLDDAFDEAQVRPLIPSRGGCIVTSRLRLAGLAVREGARQVELDPLSNTHGSRLMTRLANTSAAESSQVAALCGGLPLGLRLAAELITSGAATASNLASTRAGDVSTVLDGATDDPASQLRFLFSEASATRSEPEQKLLSLFAHCSCSHLSQHAVAAMLDTGPAGARALIDGLIEANLLLSDPAGRLSMHDLIRSWARTNAIDGEPDVAMQRLFDFYLAAADTMDRTLLPARNRPPLVPRYTPISLPEAITYDEWLEWGTDELDNMVTVVSEAVAAGDWTAAAELPHILMSLLNITKPWPQWIAMYETVIGGIDNLDPASAANMYNNLGIAYRETAQWAKAIDVLGRAEAAYGECGNNVGSAMALNNLGLCQREDGDNDASIETLHGALAALDGEDDKFRIAIVAQNLAEGELIAGRPDDAVVHAKAALAAATNVDDRVGIAITLTTIGEIQIALEDPKLAEHAFRQAATMQEELHDSHALGFTHYRLARLLANTGRHDDALFHAEQATELFEELGDDLQTRRCLELVHQLTT